MMKPFMPKISETSKENLLTPQRTREGEPVSPKTPQPNAMADVQEQTPAADTLPGPVAEEPKRRLSLNIAPDPLEEVYVPNNPIDLFYNPRTRPFRHSGDKIGMETFVKSELEFIGGPTLRMFLVGAIVRFVGFVFQEKELEEWGRYKMRGFFIKKQARGLPIAEKPTGQSAAEFSAHPRLHIAARIVDADRSYEPEPQSRAPRSSPATSTEPPKAQRQQRPYERARGLRRRRAQDNATLIAGAGLSALPDALPADSRAKDGAALQAATSPTIMIIRRGTSESFEGGAFNTATLGQHKTYASHGGAVEATAVALELERQKERRMSAMGSVPNYGY